MLSFHQPTFSVQFKMVPMHSEKPTCAQPCLSHVSPKLLLKQFFERFSFQLHTCVSISCFWKGKESLLTAHSMSFSSFWPATNSSVPSLWKAVCTALGGLLDRAENPGGRRTWTSVNM